MAERREGLRPQKPKSAPRPKKSNAQKCKDYRDRLKAEDPEKDEERRRKNHANAKKWRDSLTPEAKQRQKDLARVRQQVRREKLKEKGAASSPVAKSKLKSQPTPTRAAAKALEQKRAHEREQARIRQAKYRERIRENPQKYRRLKEKRRKKYHENKLNTKVVAHNSCKNKRTPWRVIFKGVSKTLGKCRNKVALIKLDFLKKMLAGQDVKQTKASYERKKQQNSNMLVRRFLNDCAVDIPFQKAGSKPKKVLTKTMQDLHVDFLKKHPEIKVSLSTFKRGRPDNILLSNSTKFVQCLCEKCVNIMLVMETLNTYLVKKVDEKPELNHKVTNVDELVNKTLCKNVKRVCVERKCSECVVSALIDAVKDQVGDKIDDVIEWKRWEKTEVSSKDLVTKRDCIFDVVKILERDLLIMGQHLFTAHWQRKQYQSLKDNLPLGHCIATAYFAENYLCKFQYEVQSAHWSYKQITLHPCVFFYRCSKPNCYSVVTDYKIYISDDLKHDSFMTKTIFHKICLYIESKEQL